ncbi:MAG: hypothetical protein U0X58_00670 [Flavobacteriaceae bacterium]
MSNHRFKLLDANNAITPATGITITWYDAPTGGLVVPNSNFKPLEQ